MRVIRRQGGPDFEIAYDGHIDDGHIDKEAEDSGTHKIPESLTATSHPPS